MQPTTAGSLVVALALSALVPAVGAQAQAPGEGDVEQGTDAYSSRHPFYLRVSLGGGYGHYVYTNGRNGGGGMASLSASFGAHLGDGIVFGGTVSFDPIFAVTGHAASGGPFSADLAVNGVIGPMLAFVGDVVSFEIALALGGGYTVGTGPPNYGAGGVGAHLVPVLGIWLPSDSHLRVGFHLRPTVSALFDTALPSAFETFVSVTAGVSLMVF